MISYRNKLTEVKLRLKEILENDTLEDEIDDSAIDDELDELMDSLEEVEDMYESHALNPFDENLYKQILRLKKEIILSYNLFDPEIERGRCGYYNEEDDD